MADDVDLVNEREEVLLQAAIAQQSRPAPGATLAPSGKCYGCFQDFSEAEHGEGFDKLLFCPDSAEECEGYYRQAKRAHAMRPRG